MSRSTLNTRSKQCWGIQSLIYRGDEDNTFFPEDIFGTDGCVGEHTGSEFHWRAADNQNDAVSDSNGGVSR